MDFHPEARSVADVPIVNAIDAANYKQALKLVEKRLAKKADDYLYVSPTIPLFSLAFDQVTRLYH